MYFWEMLATLGLHDCPLSLFGKIITFYLLFENRGLEVLFVSLLNCPTNKSQLLNCSDFGQLVSLVKKKLFTVLETESIGQVVDFSLFEKLLQDSYLL